MDPHLTPVYEMTHDTFRLYYWPTIQGRGEFPRLVLEDAGADYVDVARLDEAEGGGEPAIMDLLQRGDVGTPLFAPPILQHGALFVSQTAAICIYLGDVLGLSPRDESGRWRAAHLQITMADFVAEIHDTHHPIAGEMYYEEQKPEALRRARHFSSERLPKFLTYFERVLEANADSGGWLVGSGCSHADLSLFQIVEGLGYAFPNALRRVAAECPRTRELRDRVAERPGIVAYLESERRIPFNQHGVGAIRSSIGRPERRRLASQQVGGSGIDAGSERRLRRRRSRPWAPPASSIKRHPAKSPSMHPPRRS